VQCYLYGDYSFFDLRNLRSDDADYKVKATSGKTYTFNFCQFTAAPCGDDSKNAYAYSDKLPVSDKANIGDCQILTGGSFMPSKIDAIAETTDATKTPAT